jgi:hypothetical protein
MTISGHFPHRSGPEPAIEFHLRLSRHSGFLPALREEIRGADSQKPVNRIVRELVWPA